MQDFDRKNEEIVLKSELQFKEWKSKMVDQALKTNNREMLRQALEAKQVDSPKVKNAKRDLTTKKIAEQRMKRRFLEKAKKRGDLPADYDIDGVVYGK